jgi:hypothetical protein
MGEKIVKNPKGKFASNFNSDPLGEKYVDITYKRRGKLGKILTGSTKKRIKIPKGMRVTSINNNNPRVGSVRIKLKKK